MTAQERQHVREARDRHTRNRLHGHQGRPAGSRRTPWLGKPRPGVCQYCGRPRLKLGATACARHTDLVALDTRQAHG